MFLDKKTTLDLPLQNGSKFYLRYQALLSIKQELDEFLEWDKNMNNKTFAKRTMFSHEIKANNQVEGYNDDLELIQKVIDKKTSNIKNTNAKLRILNLYKGYQYILKNTKMNRDTLKELYKILSKELLDEYSTENMGEEFRTKRVYILQNGRLDLELDEGIDFEKIPNLIDAYFKFIDSDIFSDSKTDEYIKSQIMHFYFVYIHPYFDVNGRTSRTMSMWYLLNKEAYPYIIFNRGISFKGSKYDKTIRDAKSSRDITTFLLLMLETLKIELEKEHIIEEIANNTNYEFSSIDYQTLLYFLTMNGLRSLADFINFYNKINERKTPREISTEMIEPLIDSGILTVERVTKEKVRDIPNLVLSLNESKFTNNPNYLKRVKIK